MSFKKMPQPEAPLLAVEDVETDNGVMYDIQVNGLVTLQQLTVIADGLKIAAEQFASVRNTNAAMDKILKDRKDGNRN